MCYTYEYTQGGRLKRKSASGRTLLAYTYDTDGQMSSLTDVSGKTVYYEYDRLRRLKCLKNETGRELVAYEYDALDRQIKTSYGTGIITTYDYDSNGNISRLRTVGLDESGQEDQVFQDYSYQYDGNGNRTAKEGFVWAGSDGTKPESIRFIYDQKNQLIEESYGIQRTCYDYDPVGNRIRQEKDGKTVVFTYNQNNQLTAKQGAACSYRYYYDKQGSLIEELCGSQKTTYHYDSLNRQTEVIRADEIHQRNRYDAEGLRAELEENERLCRFIFHNGEIVSEEGADDRQLIRYIRGYGAEYQEREGKSYSIQKDEQNSTVLLLDRNQEIQSCYLYDGFGDLRTNRGSNKCRTLYTGQQYDGLSGQYYLRARYYRPDLGRFTQEDVYRGDGLNLYAYCANNPVNYCDPSGFNSKPNCPETLFHYTDEAGYEGILNSNEIWASTKAKRPRDARFGDGQYFTDIAPGTMKDSDLSTQMYGNSRQTNKVGYYVEVDVSGLDIDFGRDHVYVHLNDNALDISNRVVSSGRNKGKR